MTRPSLAATAVFILSACGGGRPPAPGIPDLDVRVGPTTRLLVLSPHPDDEALGAAGLIRRVAAAGGTVQVILLTSGDAFADGVETIWGLKDPRPADFRQYGALRERETTAAMQRLGVTRSGHLPRLS